MGFLLGEHFLPSFFPLFLLFAGLIVLQILFFRSQVFFLFFLFGWIVFGALLFVAGFALPWEFFREREGEHIALEGYLVEQDCKVYLSRVGGFWLYSPTLFLRGNDALFQPFLYRRVRISGTFKSFASCANPGGRDLRVHYFRKRIFGYLEVKEMVSLSSWNPWFLFLRWVWEKRKAFLEHFVGELGETYAPLFSAVFLGFKGEDFLEKARVFQEMGVYHLFCVSGFHMALLGGILWLALRRLLPQRVMSWVTLPFTFFYLAFCSFVPSASRAWIMMSLFFLSRRMGRVVTTMGILLSTFFLMFLLQPEIIFAPGAQLSFASTAGVVLSFRFLEHLLKRGGGGWSVILRYFGGAFLVTSGVLLVSFPFLVGNRLTLSSLVFLGNLLLSPLVEGVLFLALLSPLLGIFASGRLILVFCLQKLLFVLLKLSELLGKFVPHVIFDFSVGQNILWA
ncbi:MAG: ComEC/Rec2 family competence protein [Candidatus Caldatribacteriaceae bacterium]